VKRGAIHFERVAFSYDAPSDDKAGRARNVVKNFELTIPAGQRVGLVGPSGAGKTTLMGLLLRMHDVVEGAIRIDDQDIRELRSRACGDPSRSSRRIRPYFIAACSRTSATAGPEQPMLRSSRRRGAPTRMISSKSSITATRPGRRARHQTIGRTAAAHRDRAGDTQGCADSAAG
jgi:energy-coupling factor transporter ATP-binding protein EcfA2